MKSVLTAILFMAPSCVFAGVYLEVAPGCTAIGNSVTVNVISTDSNPWNGYVVIENSYGVPSSCVTYPISRGGHEYYPLEMAYHVWSGGGAAGIIYPGIHHAISFTMFQSVVNVTLYNEYFDPEFPLSVVPISQTVSVFSNSGGPYTIYESGSVTLNGSGSTSCGMNIDSYSWEIDGISVGSGQTITIVYANLPESIKSPGIHNVKLRVYGTDGLWNDSQTTLEVVRSFNIIHPQSSDAWNSGGQRLILWGTTGSVANVNLEYSIDSGSHWTLIGQMANSGSYNWVVPEHNSQNCLIKISDTVDNRVAKTSELFTIFECTLLSDMNKDCIVNLEDFSILALNWMACGDPFESTCRPFLDRGLIAYYKLDEISGTVIDEMGSHNGANYGATPSVTGVDGNAYNFDGINDYVDTGFGNGTTFNSISMSAWVFYTENRDASGIICSRSGGESNVNYGALSLGLGTQTPWFGIQGKGSAQSTDGTLPRNQWALLTGTYDGSTFKIYVNGVLKGTGAGTGTWMPGANFEIGRDNIKTDIEPVRWFKGKIDETRIYNRALTEAEIQELYLQSSRNSGLIGYWSFDNSVNIGYDDSGNQRNAVAYNNFQSVEGVASGAIRLVGSGHTGLNGGHVILPFVPLSEFSDFTISMWVKHQDNTSPYGHGESFIQFGEDNVGDVVSIAYDTGFPNGNLGFRAGNSGFPTQYTVDTWNHFVLQCHNGTLTGFVNGQSKGSTSYQLGTMQAVAGIGCHWFDGWGTSNRFVGVIDEVRIYSRALTTTEVEELFINP